MSSSEEKIAETEYDNDELPVSDVDEPGGDEKKPLQESSEFALKMINSVKEMNSGQLSHYEMVNAFSLVDELKCLFMFIQALPHRPIVPMYPETPFLFFKGVTLPRSFDLTEEMARDVETFMKGNNSDYFTDLHLHDLEAYYLDAYESAIRIYNDMVAKSRDSYHASVKLAKSQVIEVSAVFVCLIIILLTVIGIS